MSGPRVIGIDPSITATGIARADGTTCVIGGDAALGDRRLLRIFDAVVTFAALDLPDLAVLEDLPTHAHGAGITGMVQGVIRLALQQEAVPYVLITPATLKKFATGNGGANKADMRMHLFQRTGIDIRDDNQADAAWLRHAGLDHLDAPEIRLPALQRRVLHKVTWPHLVIARLS